MLIVAKSVNAEDLRTISGRVYKDATVLRAEHGSLVIAHKFGIVRIPLSDLSAETRQTFNAARAAESARRRRAEQQELAAEKAARTVEQIHAQQVAAQRAGVEVEEQNQAEAEALEARIQRRRRESAKERGTGQRYRLRGEVIGVGSDCVLVLCESDGPISRAKQELAQLRDSPFAPPKPSLTEVLIVTGLHKSVAEGETLDVRVEPIGTRRDCRTGSGAAYSGRFRAFRAID